MINNCIDFIQWSPITIWKIFQNDAFQCVLFSKVKWEVARPDDFPQNDRITDDAFTHWEGGGRETIAVLDPKK